MHNSVHLPVAKNQKDNVNHKNKKGTSFLGHDSFGGRKKRKRPKGKVTKEPPVIPCTVEELNHVLDKWIGYWVLRSKISQYCIKAQNNTKIEI